MANRRHTSATAWEHRIARLSPYSWTSADTCSIDGVTGKVASFVDRVPSGTGIRATAPSHALVQTTGANQVALPAHNASMGGRLTCTFAGSEYYVSSAAASAWKYLNDGTGCDTFIVLVDDHGLGVPVNPLLSTTNYNGGVGYFFGTGTIGGNPVVINQNRNNTPATVVETSAASTQTGTYFEFLCQSGRSPEFEQRERGGPPSGAQQTGPLANTPSNANPSNTLHLFAYPDASVKGTGQWAESLMFNRVLTTTERSVVQSYLQSKYGVV